jgi:multiple sugar transport system substrate-binding protein
MGTKWSEGSTCIGIYPLILGADTKAGDRNRLWNYSSEKWIGSSPAIERALDFYRDVFVVRELASTDAMYAPDIWGEWRRLMREGKIGIAFGGSWEWAEFWPDALRPPEEERKDVLGWAGLPGSGHPGTPSIQTISGGWTVAMNAKAKNPELVWEFLRILNSKERMAKWLGAAGKLSMRKDSADVPEYAANEFLVEIAKLLPYSDYRDALAGYAMVSRYVQQAMERVAVDGLSAAEATEWYKNKLIEEFGKDKVETIK